MAEVKNSFLASKMNKDLDDRLIPNNEYKDALNVAVSNSEGSDVGALENILENSNVYQISETLGLGFKNTGKIIGYATDASNNDIYLFYTNHEGGLNEHQASAIAGTTFSAIVKYNPDSLANPSTTILVQGTFLNFSEKNPIYGINIVEDFLFWTDDRNQPRKINIKRAAANPASSASPHYTSEDDISVAKYAPYKAMDLYKSYSGTYKTTMKDVSSEFLPDGTTANPDYNANYAGDPNYLEDKFVRFSYRIKYEDGEYSIMAPFTQIAFIPKQDGSFLAEDESKALKSTIVSFMENKVDQISLVINLPDIGNNLQSNYKIKEIDILYKESDKFTINILDTVELSEIESQSSTTSVYEYSYQSRKPIKTLPQNQSTRVYDKTPVRALAQEISGNRVIYGNFVNKHTAPAHLNYQVSVTQKFSSGYNDDYSWIEYPEHTLKRNRNYQVGFVLSDRYGRQSDVILDGVGENNVSNIFGASTFYMPYRSSSTNPTTFLNDIGNSIKIQLNETIKSDRSPLVLENASSTGEPGIYDATTNPTGWYSYKIVVKQNQQEYYNVYLPGFLKGDLGTGPETATHSVLIGDNINKVPRDLQEVGPNQTKYRSSEILFPVVQNYSPTSAGQNWNQAFFPGKNKFNVTTVAPFDALNSLGVIVAGSGGSIFENEEDPLIMRIGDNKGGLGATDDFMQPFLSIAETTPFISNIDIYYETSTSGLVSELNNMVLTGGGDSIVGFSTFDYNHNENQNFGGSGTVSGAADSAYITNEIIPVNNLNQLLTNTEKVSLSVLAGDNVDRTGDFDLVKLSAPSTGYRLKIASAFYYGVNASSIESYTFTIGLRNLDDNTTATLDSSVTSSNQIAVTVLTGNDPFAGQVLGGQGIPTATVISVDSGVVTLSTPVTIILPAATLYFTAPVTTFVKNGALRNIPPYADPTTYTTPAFSTMEGSYAAIPAYNGTFDQALWQDNLSYVWAVSQPNFQSGLGTFAITSAGGFSIITLTNTGVGSVVLYLSQSGAVTVNSGTFTFPIAFSLNATITDAGASTTTAIVAFNDVTPGAFTSAFSTAFDI